MTGGQSPPAHLRRHLVLQLPSPELADGLIQWPLTRSLIEERVGPAAVVVAEENVAPLRERLQTIGLPLEE